MSIALLAGLLMTSTHPPVVAQEGAQTAERLAFSGLARQPYAWYIAQGGPVAEACVCVGTERSGRPAGVSAVFPTGVKKIGLYFRVNESIKRSRVSVSFRQNDVEVKANTIGIPGRKHWAWWVTPRKAKTFAPGLYTFEMVRDGELLAALDVAVISSDVLPPAALRVPAVASVPPPPRMFGGAAEPSGPVEVSLVTAATPAPTGPTVPAVSGGSPAGGGDEPGTRGDLVDDLIASARNRSTDVPEDEKGNGKGGKNSGSLLGNVLGSSSPTSAAAKVVGKLFGFGDKDGPTDFIVKRTQSSQKLAERIVKSKHMADVMYALGGRRPITHAVAAVSDTKNFGRCVLILPLSGREGDPTLMALLVVDDVSVAVNDAPLVAEKGFDFSFKNDRVYALPILVDPATAIVQVLGANGETLVAGPAHLAAPEAQAQDPFASIHQVIPQDTTGDRAVAICSLTPALCEQECVSAVFPLLLSREKM